LGEGRIAVAFFVTDRGKGKMDGFQPLRAGIWSASALEKANARP
jgi:hypothetical protein